MTFLLKKTMRTPIFKNIKDESPNFLLKLYNILSTPQYSNIIQWDSTGRMVIMKHINVFTETILPLYYKHSNYSSFIRQLNMYDFHKKKNSDNEEIFYHAVFTKDNKSMISTIKRKSIKTKKNRANTNLNTNTNGNNDQSNWITDKHFNSNTNELNVFNNEVNQVIDIETNVTGKKATKVSIENTLSLLIKRTNYYKERQRITNIKMDELHSKNELCIKSNNQILKEYVSTTEYKTKLESIIMLIIEILLQKPQMKQSSSLHEPKSRKNSETGLNKNDMIPKDLSLSSLTSASISSLFNLLHCKSNSVNALGKLISKNNDYLMLSPNTPSSSHLQSQSHSEYSNMLITSPIKTRMPSEDSVVNNCNSLTESYNNISNNTNTNNNSLFNVSKLSAITINNGLLSGSHTNINRIGENSSNISIHSHNMFGFDSDDCIINTINDLSFNQ